MRIAIISPTRALANDLKRRLGAPLKRAGLAVGLKTGDDPSFDPVKAAPVLITTPESLDSLLCRHTQGLCGVRAVVVDELHLLASTARGDQLETLLERLDRVASEPLQRTGASATIADLEALARRFIGPDPVLVRSDVGRVGQRRIVAGLAPAVTLPDAAAAIVAVWRAGEAQKLLVFANTRSDTEELAALLAQNADLRGMVHAHHGSLARGERQRVERFFVQAPRAICVATMTLELGVDIGGVDRVVLVAPPPNVSSLLQRVGRGARHAAETHMLGLYQSDFEARRFEHLLTCAEAGRLFDEPVAFRPTVIAQQAVSLLFQNPKGWVAVGPLFGRLPPMARDLWSQGDCTRILQGLAETGVLRAIDHGRFVADEGAHRLFERGQMHSCISDTPATEVVDALTGRSIGQVAMRKGGKLAAGGQLALGGRKRIVQRVHGDQVFVSGAEGIEASRFVGREPPRYSTALALDFGRFMGQAPGTFRQSPLGTGQWRLAHFLGTIGGRLLSAVLTALGVGTKGRAGPFFLTLTDSLPEGVTLGSPAEIEAILFRVLPSKAPGIARLLQPGPFRNAVGPELLARWVEASVDLDGLARTIGGAHVVTEDIE